MQGPKCLRFYYHMYGRHIGNLSVSLHLLEVPINNWNEELIMLWSTTKQQGNRWIEANIDIGYTGGEFQVGEKRKEI